MLLPTADPRGFILFAVTCIAITLTLVPVGLTTSAAPAPIAKVRLRLHYLYGISPVGVVGCFVVGVANGAYVGLGPVYAQGLGLCITGVALFMSATVVGGALAQFPIGTLSDLTDRRQIIVDVCLGAAIIASILALASGVAEDIWPGVKLNYLLDLAEMTLIGIVGLFGCFIDALHRYQWLVRFYRRNASQLFRVCPVSDVAPGARTSRGTQSLHTGRYLPDDPGGYRNGSTGGSSASGC